MLDYNRWNLFFWVCVWISFIAALHKMNAKFPIRVNAVNRHSRWFDWKEYRFRSKIKWKTFKNLQNSVGNQIYEWKCVFFYRDCKQQKIWFCLEKQEPDSRLAWIQTDKKMFKVNLIWPTSTIYSQKILLFFFTRLITNSSPFAD